MPKTIKQPQPTPNELNLLRTLWRMGPSTVKDVHATLKAERPEVSYATVLRLMQVMFGKGLLTRDESQRSHIYGATFEQDEFQTSMLGDLIQTVFANSGKDLVMAALKKHVSGKELDDIKRFLQKNEHD
jgi:predicted transcriptional regulator